MPNNALPPTSREFKGTKDGDQVTIKPDPNGPVVAQVFKTRIDPFVQKLNYIRVFSGTLTTGSTVGVVGARKPVKLAQLFEVQANETEPVDEAGLGPILGPLVVGVIGASISLGAASIALAVLLAIAIAWLVLVIGETNATSDNAQRTVSPRGPRTSSRSTRTTC